MMTDRNGLIAKIALGVSLIIVAGIFWIGRSSAPGPSSNATEKPSTPIEMHEDRELPHFFYSRSPARQTIPASQFGAEIDGTVHFDAQGQPIPDADMRYFFEWFLAALGEQDLGTIRKRLESEVQHRYTAIQAQQILSLFDRYVAYLQAATEIVNNGAPLEEQLASLKALRLRMLGKALSEGFYAEEEAEAERVLALRTIRNDTSISEAQRQAAFAEIERSSPGYAQSMEVHRAQQDAMDLNRELDLANATPAERFSARKAVFGEEAASRFAELDRQQMEWDMRVEDYRRQRDALLKRNLTDAQRATEQQRLLSSFTDAEARRLQALESIERW